MLEKYRFLASGYARFETERVRARSSWQVVAVVLNRISNGCFKTPQQWAKYWRDKKVHIKRKQAIIIERHNRGEKQIDVRLSEVEKRMLVLIEKGYKENPTVPMKAIRLKRIPLRLERISHLRRVKPALTPEQTNELGFSLEETINEPIRLQETINEPIVRIEETCGETATGLEETIDEFTVILGDTHEPEIKLEETIEPEMRVEETNESEMRLEETIEPAMRLEEANHELAIPLRPKETRNNAIKIKDIREIQQEPATEMEPEPQPAESLVRRRLPVNATSLTTARQPNSTQIEMLADLLEKHRYLANGYARTEAARVRTRSAWQVVASALNRIDNGCFKGPHQWAKYWRDKKTSLKKKIANIIESQRRGDIEDVALSDVEQRLIVLLETEYKEKPLTPIETMRLKRIPITLKNISNLRRLNAATREETSHEPELRLDQTNEPAVRLEETMHDYTVTLENSNNESTMSLEDTMNEYTVILGDTHEPQIKLEEIEPEMRLEETNESGMRLEEDNEPEMGLEETSEPAIPLIPKETRRFNKMRHEPATPMEQGPQPAESLARRRLPVNATSSMHRWRSMLARRRKLHRPPSSLFERFLRVEERRVDIEVMQARNMASFAQSFERTSRALKTMAEAFKSFIEGNY